MGVRRLFSGRAKFYAEGGGRGRGPGDRGGQKHTVCLKNTEKYTIYSRKPLCKQTNRGLPGCRIERWQEPPVPSTVDSHAAAFDSSLAPFLILNSE